MNLACIDGGIFCVPAMIFGLVTVIGGLFGWRKHKKSHCCHEKGHCRVSRTLLRCVYRWRRALVFVIPGWDPEKEVSVPFYDVPYDIRRVCYPGKRLHARVNLSAQTAADLNISDWEID